MTVVADLVEAVCEWCLVAYVEGDGWGGYCASCCALFDEHTGGEHHGTLVPDCPGCAPAVEVRLDGAA